MFKSAATKIAHNTTIPALGGNRDLRPLQDLITAEKSVLISLQRLSVDVEKAAEALRIWGAGEGDDLGDILGASTTLLTLYATALAHNASLSHTMRDHLKSIRTREENFDDLKRRRKALGLKAESAEKKLSKMSAEHKHLQMQVESLNALRAEIRSMDSEIMSEEAYLGDFKRATTKTWVGLKFGGMLESCEKGTIVAEYGRLIGAEIPEEQTQPGMARSLYHGRSKIESLLSEAQRCVNQVAISTGPVSKPPRPSHESQVPEPPHLAPSLDQRGSSGAATEWSPNDPSPATGGPVNYLPPTPGLGTGRFFEEPPPPNPVRDSSQAPYLPPIQTDNPSARRSLDDFGINISGPIGQPPSGRAGHFATFPVKRPTGYSPAPFTLADNAPRSGVDESFSSSVAEALRSSQSPPGAIPSFNGPGYQQGPSMFAPPPGPLPIFAPPPGPPPGLQAQVPGRDTFTEDDATLAYMEKPYEPSQSHEQRQEQPHDGRPGGHARYGDGSYGEGELEGHPRNPNDSAPPPDSQIGFYQTPSPPDVPQYQVGQPQERQNTITALETPPAPEAAQAAAEDGPSARFQNQRRVPVPATDPVADDRVRNAAAAREVGREMEGFSFLNVTSPIALAQLKVSNEQPSRSLNASPDRERTLPPPPEHEWLANDSEDVVKPLRPAPRPWTEGSSRSRSNSPSRWATPAQSFSQMSSSQSLEGPHESPAAPPNPGSPRINTSTSFSSDSASRFPPPRLGIGLGNPSMGKSTASLNSQASAGARTISAAAFKRAQRSDTGSVSSIGGGTFMERETSPLVPRNRLPTHPTPLRQREGSPMSREGSPQRGRSRSLSRQTPPPVPPLGGGGGSGSGSQEGQYDYDYLSAYVESGSQSHAQRQGAGNVRG